MTRASTLITSGVYATTARAITGSVRTGVTAAGNSQATATAITNSTTVFSTVAASTGAVLPTGCVAGDLLTVVNLGANSLSVYPPVGGTVQTGAANAAFAVGAGKTAQFRCVADAGLTWVAHLSA